MERKAVAAAQVQAAHVAGGTNAGIVVNKSGDAEAEGAPATPPHLALEFRVFLVSASTGRYGRTDGQTGG